MLSTLHNARDKRRNGEAGFTLIELLVVVVILGILIAIAIPLYLNYKKSANDKAAQSDLRGAISTFESCSSDGGYPLTAGISSTGTVTMTGCTTQTLTGSSGTQLVYLPSTATAPAAYIAESTNSGGSGKVYCYSSAAGGSVKAIAATTLLSVYQATCPA